MLKSNGINFFVLPVNLFTPPPQPLQGCISYLILEPQQRIQVKIPGIPTQSSSKSKRAMQFTTPKIRVIMSEIHNLSEPDSFHGSVNCPPPIEEGWRSVRAVWASPAWGGWRGHSGVRQPARTLRHVTNGLYAVCEVQLVKFKYYKTY